VAVVVARLAQVMLAVRAEAELVVLVLVQFKAQRLEAHLQILAVVVAVVLLHLAVQGVQEVLAL
jgi:hypothetical protein